MSQFTNLPPPHERHKRFVRIRNACCPCCDGPIHLDVTDNTIVCGKCVRRGAELSARCELDCPIPFVLAAIRNN